MKGKMIRAVTAILAAFALSAPFAGCGEIEDEGGAQDSSLADTVSVSDDSAPDSVTDSVQDSLPVSESAPDDGSSSQQSIEVTLNTYTAADVPELVSLVKQQLAAGAGELGEFEKVFDPDLLIEANLRSAVSDEKQLKELRAQFDDESRKMTVKQDYDMLHEKIAGVTFKGEPIDLKIQTITGDLHSSILFTLNFSMDSSRGKLKFLGNAYHIDGKWGAVFELSEKNNDDIIQQMLEQAGQ